jgi:LysR substrate binding domain
MTVPLAPASRCGPLATNAPSSGSPPFSFTGALAIARPCIVAPAFSTAKLTFPALTDGTLDLTHMSPSVTSTSAPAAFAAGAASAAGGFGACVVRNIPAAPSADELCHTAMLVRDPGSNARWTVEAELRRRDLPAPPMLAQSSTPETAMREAIDRDAPVLLSRHILEPDSRFVIVPVRGLHFARTFDLVSAAGAEPSAPVRLLADGLRALAAA